MNSIPQQEVANGSGHSELARASPMVLSIVVAKNPGPSYPGGIAACFTIFYFLESRYKYQVSRFLLTNNYQFSNSNFQYIILNF
jgi:hypothetical protein